MKSINLTGTVTSYISIEMVDGVRSVVVVGFGKDVDGNLYPVSNMAMDWDALPANVQNTGDNFTKHLTREFNKLVANEDVETW